MIFATIEHYGHYRQYVLTRNGVVDGHPVTVSRKDATLFQLRKWLDVATRTNHNHERTCIMRNPDRKRLTDVEQAMLNAINTHPSLTPIELHPLVQEISGIKPSSVSAITSRLVRLKKVNRLKVPMSSTYRYYPKDATLPEGRVQWDNKLVRVDRSKGKAKPDAKPIVPDPQAQLDLHPGKAATPTPPSQVDGNILITIPFGKNQAHTLTVEQAKEFYLQLHYIFGDK